MCKEKWHLSLGSRKLPAIISIRFPLKTSSKPKWALSLIKIWRISEFNIHWSLFSASFEIFIVENYIRYSYCIIHFPSGSWCSIGQLCRQWIRDLDLRGCCWKQVCIPHMYILISLPPSHVSGTLRYYEVIFCSTEFKTARFTLNFVSIDLVEIKYNNCLDKKEILVFFNLKWPWLASIFD